MPRQYVSDESDEKQRRRVSVSSYSDSSEYSRWKRHHDKKQRAKLAERKIKQEFEELESFARQESRMKRDDRTTKRSRHKATTTNKDLKQSGAKSGFTQAELAAAKWRKDMEKKDDSESDTMLDPLIQIQKTELEQDAPPVTADRYNPLIESNNFREFLKFQKKEYKRRKKLNRRIEKSKEKEEKEQKKSLSSSSSDSYRKRRQPSSSSSSGTVQKVVNKLKSMSHGRRIGMLKPIERPKNIEFVTEKDEGRKSYSGGDRRTSKADGLDEFGRELRESDRKRKRRRKKRSRGVSSSSSTSVSSDFWDHLMYIVREKEEEEGGMSIWEERYGRRRDADELGIDTRKGAWRSRAGGVYLPAEEEMDGFDESHIHQKPVDMERVVLQRFCNDGDEGDAVVTKKQKLDLHQAKQKQVIRINVNDSDDSSSAIEFEETI